MEWTGTPLLLSMIQHLMPDIAPHWCEDNLPTQHLEHCADLHVALAGALEVSDIQLHADVHAFLMNMDDDSALTMDNCLQQKASTLKQYLSRVMNVGTLVDSLFLWASSRAYGKHINLVHENGVWTTHHTAIPDLLDAAIVFILTGYLFSPSVGAVTKSQ